jgi:hopanoid biosynthesis associated protein HpnK
VNEAVEMAHATGILSAASLMMAGAAVDDAIARARRMPSLRVGLHVVVVDGPPLLPPARIPHLVDEQGLLRQDLAGVGRTVFFRPAARRELALEITAQFDAYRATGLSLDHVNAHHHFHVHPTVTRQLLAIGPAYGMRAVRVPNEPYAIVKKIDPATRRAASAAPWARLLRTRLRRRGIVAPAQVFGLAWSGALNQQRLAGLLDALPDGVTEIYSHPAVAQEFDGSEPGCDYIADLAALVAPDIVERVRAMGLRTGGYADVL